MEIGIQNKQALMFVNWCLMCLLLSSPSIDMIPLILHMCYYLDSLKGMLLALSLILM